MYEEVKTYLAAIEAAQEAYAKAPPELLGSGHDEKTCRYCVRDVAAADAWEALKASSVPLVAWIAENAAYAQTEAQVILEALPASMAVLDGIAKDKHWCADWDGLRASAERAGVLPQDAEVSA